MIKKITIPEEVSLQVQKANTERDSRKDLILYILEHDEVHVSEEAFNAYKAEYDEKYLAFEKAKNMVEENYVKPAADGQIVEWSLDYATCVVSIKLPDE